MNTLELLNITHEQKIKGVWFSGKVGHGEYKRWHNNGQLYIHCFYKNNKIHGEYTEWCDNGQMYKHLFYKKDKRCGEYKRWLRNGELVHHCLYKDGIIIESYLG